MKFLPRKIFIPLSFLFGIISFAALLAPQAQNRKNPDDSPDVSKFPLADYKLEKEKAKLNRNGRKYNRRYAPRISEGSTGIFSVDDWEVGLQALPVSRSCAVITGEVTASQAHLSDDETNIYSEFTVKVDEIFKNDNHGQIGAGSSLIVERAGGRVRLPSGKIVVAQTSHQDLPQVGKRYALFLTHEFPDCVSNEDFRILTGYELRNGHVFPLDKLVPGHPIASYAGIAESSFFADLAESLQTN